MKKHSVLLKEDLCEGCTNCVKNCPTKAIRVHKGKATIKEDLCIDCAECIRTCAYHAKYTETNHLDDLQQYKYPVALIPPSFYGQFDNVNPIKIKLALKELGFKVIKDVALSAEALTVKTNNFLKENSGMYISSSCPVIVRLIRLLYPELLGNIIPFKSPVELMGEKVKKELQGEGILKEEIGVFFITPCPAKLTTVYESPGLEQGFLDGAIAVDLVYQELIKIINKAKEDNHKKSNEATGSEIEVKIQKESQAPYLGIGWGRSGGETGIMDVKIQNQTLSVSGIHNVKALLEELSRSNVKGIKYFELVACNEGCVGGVLNVKNPFQARFNLRKLREKGSKLIKQDLNFYDYNIDGNLEAQKVGSLDDDLEKAMEKLDRLEKEIEMLPGLDCAACGAPDCQTLAEDIVTGKAERTDCVFVLRKQVAELADRMARMAHALPPVMKDDSNHFNKKD